MSQPAIDIRARRDAYYQRIAAKHLTPLWESMSALVPEHPQSPCVPMIWRYDELRPWLLEAGQLISAQEAVRRVLILENPACLAPPRSRSLSTLACSLFCPGRLHPVIVIHSRRYDSSLRAVELSPP